MRILITGAVGFVGRHLARELKTHGHVAIGLDHVEPIPPLPEFDRCMHGDIRIPDVVRRQVRETAPDACVHLAAFASVPACRDDPGAAFSVNVEGTLNVLEAIRQETPSARILFVSSSYVYPQAPPALPIPETATLAPATFYGLTKSMAESLVLYYAREHSIPIMITRPVNHTGPGQSTAFAIPAFAARVAAMAEGAGAPVLRVGNLESTRDFLDVRDTVRAYRLLLERGRPGHIYNLAGGHSVRVGDALDRLCRIAGVHPRIEPDPALFRPTDHSPRLDTRRIVEDTGWAPTLSLDQTLRDVYRSA